MKIATLVILYQPKAELIYNIHSYINEVEKLYVVDNSEKVNADIRKELEISGFNFEYISNQRNLGIALALNQGAAAALNDGFDWLLTMDQDSHFYDNSFFNAVRNFKDNSKVALFSPAYTHFLNFTSQDSEYMDAEKSITSGSLINLSVWKSVAGFQDDLFIDEVDIEYCLRVRKKGYRIILFEHIYLIHEVGRRYKTRSPFTGKEFDRSEHMPFRYYYISRNILYVNFKYLLCFPITTIKRLIYFPRMIYGVILYENEKKTKLFYIVKGICHFLINKRGKLQNI
jgi:rhamnosyltransferase